jgi:hypothetical protein
MECRHVQELIRCNRRFAGGLSDGDRDAVREHLLRCPGCAAYGDREAAFDTAVRPVMLDVAVPIQLQERILRAMRKARRARQRRRVLYASLVAAAALFLAITLGWYSQRPYDLRALQEEVDRLEQGQPADRYELPMNPSRAGLKSWLVRNGISTPIPSQLRLDRLTGAYLVHAGGRKVPVLELRSGPAVSRVFLLERRFFSEGLRRKLYDGDNVVSFIVADPASNGLGWMITDPSTASQFVDGELRDPGY